MPAAASYLIGSVVRVSVSITDCATNILADPGGLILKVKPPAEAPTTFTYGVDSEVIKDADGVYHADITLDKSGEWRWRWEASTPNVGVVEGDLAVRASRVV
ncbi:hypothetical protein [Nitrosospira sp. NpAV]|uniref:hypothetical protein n=1 Tax=Nitrosospira sp. NpAV TaxID=58133 RepID=UPI00059F469F|nr:hypothetical protein [Nitrosospira sp. NpAV]KIO49601.1 hypothetical protein SQ11_05625 [Nitrosospira sp. NpAV]